jgi:hypothetical protein
VLAIDVLCLHLTRVYSCRQQLQAASYNLLCNYTTASATCKLGYNTLWKQLYKAYFISSRSTNATLLPLQRMPAAKPLSEINQP